MAATDHRPLAGRRIVVTRAPEQAAELARRLAALGAEVVLLPLLDFVPAQDTAPLDDAILHLGQFDWLLFTSQNAAEFFGERCRQLGVAPGSLSERTRVGVVGPATEAAASAAGFRVDRVSSRQDGLGLAAELRKEITGKRVLLPRSDRARPDLPAALREAGAAGVVEVIAYRNVASEAAEAEAVERVLSADVDVITFASPSAFHRLQEFAGPNRLPALAGKVAMAAIGSVTADAIRQAGFPVAIVAEQPTSAGLADAIVKYYAASSEERVIRR